MIRWVATAEDTTGGVVEVEVVSDGSKHAHYILGAEAAPQQPA